MEKVQHFEFSYGDSCDHLSELLDVDLLKPVIGDSILERLVCLRVEAAYLIWGPSENIPPEDFLKQKLQFGPIKLNSAEDSIICIERRFKGEESNALESLLKSWLREEGYSNLLNCYVATKFKLSGELDGAEWSKLETVFSKLASMVGKSPLYDSKTQDLRIIVRGLGADWIGKSETNPKISLNQTFIHEQLQKASVSSSRLGAIVQFSRESGPEIERVIRPPLDGLARERPLKVAQDLSLDLLLGVPRRKNPGSYPWVSVSREIDAAVSVFGRGPSYLGIRSGYSYCHNLSVISAVPQLIKEPVDVNSDDALFVVGPWVSSNFLAERLIEEVFKKFPDAIARCLLADSSENWIFLALMLLQRSDGFHLDHEVFENLVEANQSKGGKAKLMFVRCDERYILRISEGLSEYGLKVQKLGSPNSCGSIVCRDLEGKVDFELTIESLRELIQSRFNQKLLGRFSVPNTKSTTFGYDRAVIYPDQYLMKITNIPKMKRPIAGMQWSFRSSNHHLAVQMRRPETTYLNTVKLDRNQSVEIVSFASVRRTIDIDPIRSGHVALDQAIRSHLCQGSSLVGLQAETFVSMPCEDFSKLTHDQMIQVKLLLEGINYACLQYEVDNLGERFVCSSDTNQEIFAWVRLKSFEAKENVSQVFSGFRIDQESIISLGPRPPFVDAGSRILGHVRVFSNYLTELDFAEQLVLYKRIVEMLKDQRINCLYPIGPGGIAEALFEMALWGGRGVLLKSMVNTIELFSGAPGRVLIGVGAHEVDHVEREFESEKVLQVGVVSGDKVLGLSLEEIQKGREYK